MEVERNWHAYPWGTRCSYITGAELQNIVLIRGEAPNSLRPHPILGVPGIVTTKGPPSTLLIIIQS